MVMSRTSWLVNSAPKQGKTLPFLDRCILSRPELVAQIRQIMHLPDGQRPRSAAILITCVQGADRSTKTKTMMSLVVAARQLVCGDRRCTE
jgi:hypothetical protein